MKNILISFSAFCVLFLGAAGFVHAQTYTEYESGGEVEMDTQYGTENAGSKETVSLDNPLVAKDITELFMSIIDILLVFAVPIIVFFIIYAGFLYVTARGNPQTIQKAHMALLYALIGGLLILGARVLIDVIGGTVDVFKE